KQGMSVGWGDTYGYWLSGQEVDFTGNPDGTYRLFIEIDPYDRLYETNELDNESCVQLEISNLAVRNVGECP
uniref:lysyl oxidase family protein n=1 Tax=Methyloglobulus sp. TaxID=2518622 RepID=UPI0039890D55